MVLPGDEPGLESMTVIPLKKDEALGTNRSADALAAAASELGFWVDANGMPMGGETLSHPGHRPQKGTLTVFLFDSTGRPKRFLVPAKSGVPLRKLPSVIQNVVNLYHPSGGWIQAPHLELFLRPGNPPPPLFPPGSTWLNGIPVSHQRDSFTGI
jgi:hypothetical protein